MPFMEPEILKGDWYEIETRDGSTSWVPVDLAGNPAGLSDGETVTADDDCDAEWAEARSSVWQYVEGEPYSVTLRRGWYGYRLSAPGHLDCTDWEVCQTEAEARDGLRGYGVCPDCGLDCDRPADEPETCQCEEED